MSFAKGPALAGLTILAAHGAAAQAQTVRLDEIVVTPNLEARELSEVGSSVEIISKEDLREQGQAYLTDYLAEKAGISVTQNGPPGTTATFAIRGAYQRYIKVLVDGIDISDPSAPQTAVDFGQLTADEVERVEILKGSQSTLYGGDAVGGVVSITTRGADGPGLRLSASGELGSYRTARGQTTVAYGADRGRFAATVNGIDTNGFSAADRRDGNKENDGYKALVFSSRGDFDVSDDLTLFAAIRHSNSDVDFDDYAYPAGPVDNDANRTQTVSTGGRAGANWSLFDDRLSSTASVQGFKTRRDTFGSFRSRYDGDRVAADYQGTFAITDRISVMGGADWEKTGSDSDGGKRDSAHVAGLFAQLLAQPIDGLSLSLGARHDDHSAFGGFDTWRGTAAYVVAATGTKLRGSIGTGYRAPSLFELYAPFYGNRDLKPEKSFSWDIGVDQPLWDDRALLSATWFRLDTDKLIEYVYAISTYRNVSGTTKRQGLELAASVDPLPWLGLWGNYTYTRAETAAGDDLVRVPRHDFNFGVKIKPLPDVSLLLSGRYVAGMKDTDPAGRLVNMQAYTLVNGIASYRLNDHAEVYVRGENLLNQHYQTVYGYGTAERSGYLGVRLNY